VRWILIGLLLINSIYFLWQNYTLPERGVASAGLERKAVSGDYNQLLLLSELPGTSGGEGDPPGLTSAETVAVQGQSAVVQKASDLAESDQFWAATKAADAEFEPPVETLAPAAACWLIGPFVEQVSGRQVVNRLAALDLTLKLLSRVQSGKPDYWVYIPPQVSRKVAIGLLRELQSNKIDSYLITDGELSRGLSLGFFTEQARADAVHQERIAQGYDARIKIVPRQYTEFWGIFDTRINGDFTQLLWEKVQSGNKALERHKNNCDRIASLDNLD